MSTAARLVVRADGGPGIGAGHLARCLALTEAWVDSGGVATLVSADVPPWWEERYRREGVDVRDPGETPYDRADWTVLDGYHFTVDDQQQIRARGTRLLSIDDHGHLSTNGADLVLDQNLGATAETYADRSPHTDLLLGPRYALLRREFREAPGATRLTASRARRLVVSVGGSPSAATVEAFDAVLADPALAALEIVRLAGANEVAPVLRSADIALAASGSTSWELCCTGVPAVLVPVAANQEPVARGLAAAGAVDDAGPLGTIDPSRVAGMLARLAADPARREAMSRRGRELVDGRGAKRVTARLRSDLLHLRRVTAEDAGLLWAWTNDPAVRAAGRSPAPIRWESHVEWLTRRLADPGTAMWVASGPARIPLGVVRFQQDGERAEISVSVGGECRGRGWGAALIDAGVRQAFAERTWSTVTARIKPQSQASLSSFEDAGFVRTGEGDEDGIHWIFYKRSRGW